MLKLNLNNDLDDGSYQSDLISKFSEELSDFLNNNSFTKNQETDNLLGTKDIIEKFSLNSKYTRELYDKRDDLLEDYAEKLESGESLYYVNTYSRSKQSYGVLEYTSNGKENTIYLDETQLQSNVQKGFFIVKENNEWKIDINITKDFIEKMEQIAGQLAKEQEAELDGYRKEEGIYQVIENTKSCIYLKDMETDDIFEEVKFSEELFDKLTTDYIIRYENGEYVYDEVLTDEFFESLEN